MSTQLPGSKSTHPYRASIVVHPYVATWRDYRPIIAAFVAMAALLVSFLSSSTWLSCNRATGSCLLLEQTVSGKTERSIPVADVTDVYLKVVRSRKSTKIEIGLLTKSAAIVLEPAGSEDEMRAFASAARAFVRTPTEERLDVSYGSVWAPVETWSLIFAFFLVLVVYLRPFVRIRVDDVDKLLVFEVRPFGRLLARRRAFPLASVREANVRSSTWMARGGLSFCVELAMVDGTSVMPGSWATASPRQCRFVADQINAVLVGTKNQAKFSEP